MAVSGRDYVLSCDVMFNSFRTNYPRILYDTTNSFQLHGMGPAYGSDRGKITFYVNETGSGPHGRGIRGYNHSGGCLVSNKKIVPNVWHRVVARKTMDELVLSVTVDGVTDTVRCAKLDPSSEGFVSPCSGTIYNPVRHVMVI